MTSNSNADAIQRVLFICSKVHVYSIPPLASNKGYVAGTWTENNNAREIFLARLRILETSVPPPASNASAPDKLSVDVLLEDQKSAELFACAPYTNKSVVEAAIDSSRFHAIRVVGDGGQKATLGIGFEDRSESIDFGICLQECRKVLGYESGLQVVGGSNEKGPRKTDITEKKDWSLKEGETIRVDIDRKGRRAQVQAGESKGTGAESVETALFSIKPPPSTKMYSADDDLHSNIPTIAAPQTAQQARSQKRRSRGLSPSRIEAKEFGFDDGEFGEFQ